MGKKISIILPVYNSEKTIERTIKSILQQSYKNFELIIINDGSKDNSGKICELYENRFSKVIKYIKINNGGVSNARNIGLERATGDYIMFIDADDEYYSNTLEEVNKYIVDENELIIFGYERIHVDTGKIKKMNTENIYLKNGIKIFIETLQKKYLFNQIWNKVYKKRIILQNQIRFDTNISLGEDYKFNLKYIEKIKNAIFISEILYKYYTSENGLSLKNDPERMYIKLENLSEQKKLYEKLNYDISYLDNNFVYDCISGLVAMKIKNDVKKTNEYIERYINNNQIRYELSEIKKRTKKLKIKTCISILCVKNIFVLKIFINFFASARKLYRKIKLG